MPDRSSRWETPGGSRPDQIGAAGTMPSRRGFLARIGFAAAGSAIAGVIPFAQDASVGMLPSARAQSAPGVSPGERPPLNFPGKSDRLVVLGERPLVAETPEHLLDDDTTPIDKFFVRNNGQLPQRASDPDQWKIVIDGEVENRLELSLGELKTRFRPVSRHLVLECGGNGRSFFTPPGRGNQWTNGGVGCAEWTGVRLTEVLQAATVKSSAVFSGHYGADPHLSGEPNRQALSRGVPIAKLMDENNLIVFAMNGEPLPHIHGGPVRLLIPGWPGSVSAKWLTRIWLRDKVHDGAGMGGTSYRVPIKPMIPGGQPDEANFRDLESMPVRSIITRPSNGTRLPAGTRAVDLRGAAWAGDLSVRQVDVSIDYGATWQRSSLGEPRNKYDWQRWTATVRLPSDGYFEVWTRATDQNGRMQPHAAGNWNPQGYGANPMHRIAVLAA